MKRVIIIRHAKAVPYGYSDDFNRDLRERGENDAKRISKHLKEQHVFPDFMVTSPAKRAKKTAHIFAKTLNFKKKHIIEFEDLYDGLTTDDFIEMLSVTPEEHNTVFVFGHNPGVYYFVHNLLEEFNSDMPTCSTVAIDFNVDSWLQISPRTGKMAFQYIPKMFRET